MIKDKNNIIVWGAAENTVRLFQYTNLSHYSIKGFVDNNKVGWQFFGKTVQAPKDILWEDIDAVVISSFYHENEIEHELSQKYGFAGTVIKLNSIGQTVPFYQHFLKEELCVPESFQDIVSRNKKFKNIHAGSRLFILCCGPSIRQMDLTVLKDEITMAVSDFYLHKDIKVIQPDYYCNAAHSLDPTLAKSVTLEYMKEVKKYVGNSVYFFSALDKQMVDESQAFDAGEVNYYYYRDGKFPHDDIDLCQKIMPVQSVPILCLQIALYMGFKEIYLIGTEHDMLTNMQYKHFYDENEAVADKAGGEIDEQGNVTLSYSETLGCIYNLWEQYKVIKNIAEGRGVNIYNATIGGVLDVFDRVDFKQLF